MELPKTVRRRTASSVCPRPPHPEERACGSAAANQVVRARVSKDGAAIPLMLRDASQRSRAVDAFELAWAAMLLSMRASVVCRTNLRLWETIAGSVPLFPACYLQWIAQLQRVERSARAASRRSSERRGRANRSCANFAMAGPWRRGDNAWAALRHATCHATRDEPCGSEVEG